MSYEQLVTNSIAQSSGRQPESAGIPDLGKAQLCKLEWCNPTKEMSGGCITREQGRP